MDITDLQPIKLPPLHPVLTHTAKRGRRRVQARPIGDKILLVWTDGKDPLSFEGADGCFLEVRRASDGELIHEADGDVKSLDAVLRHWSTARHIGRIPKIAWIPPMEPAPSPVERKPRGPAPPPPLERKKGRLRILPPDSKRRRRSPRIKD